MASNSILDIKEILTDYSTDIQEAITEEAQSIAKKGVAELKITSPKKTGSYQKGWRVKTEKGKGYVNCTIHNATDYQLTHLLERPHVIKNQYGEWGTTKPKEHIAPVEQKYVKEYQSNVEKIIKNGG